MIGKKNKIETNYIAQLIINKISSDENGKSKRQEKNAILMDKNKNKKAKTARPLMLGRPRVLRPLEKGLGVQA